MSDLTPGRELTIAPRDQTDEQDREALAAGLAIQGYCDFKNARKWAAMVAGPVPHDVWYTERNGDPITMIVPAGTEPDRLPSSAICYAALEWIKPEDDFGSGVVPLKYRRNQ